MYRLAFAPFLFHPAKIEGYTGTNAVSEEAQQAGLNLTGLAADIVSAYVSNNPVPPTELPALIAQVHSAVANLGTATAVGAAASDAEVAKPTPAQIRKSIRDDGIVSFIDGKVYKTLKRHLTAHGFDPRAYRERYGLPADYPMVAPSYAAQRSVLARASGLGSHGGRVNQRKARKSA
jgi:predicted transcriptional regulator